MESSDEASQSGDASKPSPTPKPLFTPKPFSLQRNTRFRSINAPTSNRVTSTAKPEHPGKSEAKGSLKLPLTSSALNPSKPTSVSAPEPSSVSAPAEKQLEITKESEAPPHKEATLDSSAEILESSPKKTPPKEAPEPVQKDNVIQTNHNASVEAVTNLEQKDGEEKDESQLSVGQKLEEASSDRAPKTSSTPQRGGSRKRISMELTSKFESGGLSLPPQPTVSTTSSKDSSDKSAPSNPEQKQTIPETPKEVSDAGGQKEDYSGGSSIKRRISLLFDSSSRPEVMTKREEPEIMNCTGGVKERIRNWAAEKGSEGPKVEKKPEVTTGTCSKGSEPAAVPAAEKTPQKLTPEVPEADEASPQAVDPLPTVAPAKQPTETQTEKPKDAVEEDKSLESASNASGEQNKAAEGDVQLRSRILPAANEGDSAAGLGSKRNNGKRRSVRFGTVVADDGGPPVILGSEPESSTDEEEEEEEEEEKTPEDKTEEDVPVSVPLYRRVGTFHRKDDDLKRDKEKILKHLEFEKKQKEEESEQARLKLEEEQKQNEEREKEKAKQRDELRLKEEEMERQRMQELERERLREEEVEKVRRMELLQQRQQEEEEERLKQEAEREKERRKKEEERKKEQLRKEAEERERCRRLQEEEQLRERQRQQEEEERKRIELERKLQQEKEEEIRRMKERQRQEEEEERKRIELERKLQQEKEEEIKRMKERKRQEEEERKRIELEKKLMQEKEEKEERKRLELEKKLKQEKEEEERKRLELEKKLKQEKEEEMRRMKERQRQEEEERKRIELEKKLKQGKEEEDERKRIELEKKLKQEKEEEEERKRIELEKKLKQEKEEEEERKRLELEKKLKQEKEEEEERKRQIERQRAEERKRQMEKERAEALERKMQEELERKQVDKLEEKLRMGEGKERKESKPTMREEESVADNGEQNLISFDSENFTQMSETLYSRSSNVSKHTESLIDFVFDDFSIKKPPIDVDFDDFSVKPKKRGSRAKVETAPISCGTRDVVAEEELLVSMDVEPQESQEKVEKENVSTSATENLNKDEVEEKEEQEQQEEEKERPAEEQLISVEEEEKEENEDENTDNDIEVEVEEDEAEEDDDEAHVNSYCTSNEDKDTDALTDGELHSQDGGCEQTPETDSPKLPTGLHSEDADTTDALSETNLSPLPEISTSLLDTSAQRSKADVGKKRFRSRPSRSLRVVSDQKGKLDWQVHDTTGGKEASFKQNESDFEEEQPKTKAVCSPPPSSQRVSMFPGPNAAALIAQIKQRTGGGGPGPGAETKEDKVEEKEYQDEEVVPSPPQPSRSPRSAAHLAGAALVLPPLGNKDRGAVSSPAWLKELKSKKRMSQHGGET